MPVKVFISYKHQNKERNQWVENLYKDLRSAGIDAKLDTYEVAPGESFSDYMTHEIRQCDYVLFIVTPKAVKAVESGSGALAFEMQISNARHLAKKDGFRIIPIFREGKATSTYLSDHRYLNFRDNSEYDAKLAELIQWLSGDVQAPILSTPALYLTLPEIKEYLQDAYRIAVQNNLQKDHEFHFSPEIFLEITKFRTSLQFHFLKTYEDILKSCDILPLSNPGYAFLYAMASNLEPLGVRIHRPSRVSDDHIQRYSSERSIILFDLIMLTGALAQLGIRLAEKSGASSITLLFILDDDRFFPRPSFNKPNVRLKFLFKVSEIIEREY
jgi:hypothetical protein